MSDKPDESKRQSLPSRIVRQLDERTIHDLGIPGLILMENAGQEAARVAGTIMKANHLSSSVLLAGRGNNAGDAFVVARHLQNAGFETLVLLAFPENEFKKDSDACRNLNYARLTGVDIRTLVTCPLSSCLSQYREKQILLIDGLLGTGIRGAPRPPLAQLIDDANESGHKILSLDLPSGLNADSGETPGSVIRAYATVTFGIVKAGLVTKEAQPYVGHLHLAPISIPKFLIDEALEQQGDD
ncbi:MAG: hydroxyethylthiazole kinase-like uncharacterized protein yjeF [Planctomycetota bacterium]|jgi:hydroxyethylthiazole kinase-like uncharacterized protein yjeF